MGLCGVFRFPVTPGGLKELSTSGPFCRCREILARNGKQGTSPWALVGGVESETPLQHQASPASSHCGFLLSPTFHLTPFGTNAG